MTKEPRMFSQTIVNNEVMGIYEREEKHGLGEPNGCPDNWWLKEIRQYPQDDGSLKEVVNWIPWIDKCIHRPCWDIEVRQRNHTKQKWGETQINSGVGVTIYCNQRPVYTFTVRDIEYALAKAQTLLIDLGEHPFNFIFPEKEIGRKVWYHNQPAIIDRLLLDQGCIMLKYDGEGGFDMKHPWDRPEDGGPSEWDGESSVKDDILSSNIWWFRDD